MSTEYWFFNFRWTWMGSKWDTLCHYFYLAYESVNFVNVVLPMAIIGIRMFLVLFISQANQSDYDNYVLPSPHQFYDFIVVGSGSAGSVVGARLSEEAGWDVLVLEAGGPPPPESYVPAMDILLYITEADWGYKVEPQKHSMFAYTGNSNRYPRGHALGGSSTTNYMMYVRGNKNDFDSWSDLGNPGWDYQTVLNYFKKSEDYTGDLDKNNSAFHGFGGPLTISRKSWGTNLEPTFLEAGLELGYPTLDINAQSQSGFSTPDMTIKNGVRQSSSEAFLRPNLKRKNLNVVPFCHVTKILINDKNRAIGVKYLRNGQEHIVLARREVIISAGAVDSPKLLMLSGIGPSNHLTEKNITVVHHLPGVGQNLNDHPVIFGLSWTTNSGSSLSPFHFFNLLNIFPYFTQRTGPLSSPFGVEGNAWAQLSGGDPEWPDSQFLLMSVNPTFDNGLLFQNLIGFDRQLFETYFAKAFGSEGFSIGPILLRPKSRGSITLRNNDPIEPPIINPNFLANPEDVHAMVRAIKFALAIGNTKAFKDGHGAKFHDAPLPGCDHHILESDRYWECFARFMTSTVYHTSGTCKMALANDTMGVVDHRLRVHGISNLRVIDASIMPHVVSGNTNAASIMIGERGADLVKEDWINEIV